MSSKQPSAAQDGFSMDGGDVRGWSDAGVAMIRCVTRYGDPVEMNETELSGFISLLQGLHVEVADRPGPPDDTPTEVGSGLQHPLVALRELIDEWCEKRELVALSRVLPTYLAVNGLTDGWADLRSAVRATGVLTEYEGRLRDVERALDRMLDGAW